MMFTRCDAPDCGLPAVRCRCVEHAPELTPLAYVDAVLAVLRARRAPSAQEAVEMLGRDGVRLAKEEV